MSEKVWIYDTTLRDGSQAEGIWFSLEDKLKILTCLDSFGVDYIEGGWPSSNPKDTQFFERAKDITLRHAKLCAFGSTRHKSRSAQKDPNLQGLIAANTEVVTIFGKAWIFHVERILGVTGKENLALVSDSIKFLKDAGREVIFDAEHFYDGYKDDASYALEVLNVAREAGADWLVLCDTNGGTIGHEFREITKAVLKQFPQVPLGVHCHNDSGTAVANSIDAVQLGVTQVQGTFGGIGERCGNADLIPIIANLILKLNKQLSVDREKLKQLCHVARYVSAVANHQFPENTPYVGSRAFAHKGGVHVNSVMKESRTYEHVDPAVVGADRRFLVSELSGRSNILHIAKKEGIDFGGDDHVPRAVVNRIKQLELQGYQFEGAEASAALILRKMLGQNPVAFELVGFRVIVEKRSGDERTISEATVKVSVNGKQKLSVGEGNGPVAALDAALRSALYEFYPEISNIRLTDYRVRVIDEDRGAAAKVRVIINSADQEGSWGTVGASENIIEASWIALVDSIIYGLIRKGVLRRHTSEGSNEQKEELKQKSEKS